MKTMNGNTMKKKLTSLMLIALMLVAALGFATAGSSVYAAENEITVYVTVSNAGELGVTADGTVAVNLPVAVAADANGQATVDAALTAFHGAYFPGGYATSESAYGLAVDKLWGVENGGSYLFAINNVKCNSGVGYDLVGDGDALTAVVMKDLTYWADLIAGFDKSAVTAKVGEEVELTLSYDEVTYDADWNPTHGAKAVAGADVFVAGVADDVLAVTDENGKAVVSFDEAGTYVVSASGAVTMQVQDWSQGGAYVDADAPISAPACVVTVEAEDEPAECVHEYEEGFCAICGEADPNDVAPEDDEELNAGGEEESVTEDEPADEEEPVVEDEPVKEEPTDEAEKAPATGDNAQLAVYLMMLMAAGAAMATLKRQK